MRTWQDVLNRGAPADVAFLLEGTYPYVSGGVTSVISSATI